MQRTEGQKIGDRPGKPAVVSLLLPLAQSPESPPGPASLLPPLRCRLGKGGRPPRAGCWDDGARLRVGGQPAMPVT